MQEISTILFPTDFSESAQNAFRCCLRLAGKYNAEVHVLHVIYPEYEAMDLPVVATQATRAKVNAARVAIDSFINLGLSQVGKDGNGKTPVITSDIEIGSAVNLITQIAERDGIDLIVMGTKGEHGALERAFGSVTTGVIRRAPCTVWIVPEGMDKSNIHVAAYASNLTDADPFYIWKVGKLLEPFNPVLHCVHVNIEHSVDHVLELADLGAIFGQHAPMLQINFHTLTGASVADSLEEFADTYDVDLMIMLTPHYNWLEGLFHRSQTRRMALDAKVPLLILKEKE